MKLKYSLIACALLLCIGAHAQKGLKNLFNGKDLTGWKQRDGKAKSEVKNKEIIGIVAVSEFSSFLATEQEYGDFILELLVDTTMNSGIQIRSESKADYKNGRVFGYQVEIDPSKRAWSGGIYDGSRRGWLYPFSLNPGVVFSSDAFSNSNHSYEFLKSDYTLKNKANEF